MIDESRLMLVRHGWNCSRLHQSRDIAWQWIMGIVMISLYVPRIGCCVSTIPCLLEDETDLVDICHA